MDSLDYWRLADELSVFQAAVLIAGGDPGGEESNVEQWPVQTRPPGYEAAKSALQNAIQGGRLPAVVRAYAVETGVVHLYAELDAWQIVRAVRPDGSKLPDDAVFYYPQPDWSATTVLVEDLRAWLRNRGLKTGFFFPEDSTAPEAVGYLDPAHPRYAAKLAAAVKAWQAVEDPKGKHPKQALEKWLREHASAFGLSDDDGKPNETGIEECSKVANWQPRGGSAKTPG